MPAATEELLFASLRQVARRFGLAALVLFGSRSRSDFLPRSDWDFGFVAGEPIDVLAIAAEISGHVADDHVDLVDLSRAGGLLRFRAARDGKLVYEAAPGTFDRFRFDAARFWYDAEPILRRGYEQVLERLG